MHEQTGIELEDRVSKWLDSAGADYVREYKTFSGVRADFVVIRPYPLIIECVAIHINLKFFCYRAYRKISVLHTYLEDPHIESRLLTGLIILLFFMACFLNGCLFATAYVMSWYRINRTHIRRESCDRQRRCSCQ